MLLATKPDAWFRFQYLVIGCQFAVSRRTHLAFIVKGVNLGIQPSGDAIFLVQCDDLAEGIVRVRSVFVLPFRASSENTGLCLIPKRGQR